MTDEAKKEKKVVEKGGQKENAPAENAPRGGTSGAGKREKNIFDRRKGGRRSPGRDRSEGGRRRPERAKPEFDQKILNIRRVTRVVSGGRRFSFSVTLVAGDRRGKVGVGTGKAADTSLAVEKAYKNAKKNMIKVRTTKDMSVGKIVKVKVSSARLMMMPAPGRGIIAGSAARTVLELAGIKDVGAKILSPSKNKLNIARAAVLALSKM